MSTKPDTTKTRGEEEEAARRRLFKGTRLCKFFLAGCCSRGEACNFAHSVDNLRDFPDFSKTRLCEPFMKSGKCEQGSKCKFAHTRDELRPSYISSAKSRRTSAGSATAQAASPQSTIDGPQVPTSGSLQGDQPLAQLQSLAPAAKAGIIHSAAMYTLILQGISGQGSGQSRESLQMHSSARPAAPDTSQRACPSPTAIDKGGANWSRQSTAEVPDDHNRFSRQTTEDPNYSRQTTAFSRQTTEDPSYTSNLSRQTTEEPRRQLPLSQLLSLPEPSERTEPSSRQHSSRASRAGSSEMEAPERTEQSDELNVRLKNTFLHFETAPTGSDGSTKARPSSLPPSLPGRRSQTDRPPSRT